MNISAPFIVRPIATTLLIAAIVLLGGLGYRLLSVAALPTVEFPTIQVVTQYPGASPDVMQTAISAPLEHYLGRIPGLNYMTSASSFGTSQITLQFSLSRDIVSASQDVQAAINATAGWLPMTELPVPPVYHQVNPADLPVLSLALTSDTMPLYAITEFASTAFIPKLSQVEGVGEVSAEGGQARAVRLAGQSPPACGPRAFARGRPQGDRDHHGGAAEGADRRPATGLSGRRQRPAVRCPGDFLTPSSPIANWRTRQIQGRRYRRRRPRERETRGLVQRQTRAHSQRETAARARISSALSTRSRRCCPRFEKSAPGALRIDIAADRTTTIRAAVADVQMTLTITVVLVVMVIFLFLRKFWATLIPSVTLPVSLIATFGVMWALGFSLDNLSLMALSIASGFIVDDAIVMIENIVRYIELGERPLDAALKGSRQIGFTIVSLTISLIAVFIPLLLMGGVVGRLFREFAITLSVSVIISGILSLILTPMMCAALLEPHDSRPHGKLFLASERAFGAARDVYEAGLRWSLRHQRLTLGFTVLTFAASIFLYVIIPKGFVPAQDTGLLIGVTEAAQDVSFEAMTALQQKIAGVISEDPDVAGVISFVGVGADNPTINSGRLYIDIGTPEHRHASAAEIMRRLRDAAAEVHDIQLHLQPVQDIQIETRPTPTQFQYVLQRSRRKRTAALVRRNFWNELKKQKNLADVVTDQQEFGQQMLSHRQPRGRCAFRP